MNGEPIARSRDFRAIYARLQNRLGFEVVLVYSTFRQNDITYCRRAGNDMPPPSNPAQGIGTPAKSKRQIPLENFNRTPK
jgi:hypothetical protein